MFVGVLPKCIYWFVGVLPDTRLMDGRMDGWTDGRTDGRTDRVASIGASTKDLIRGKSIFNELLQITTRIAFILI